MCPSAGSRAPAGPWTIISQVAYSYYILGESYGNEGNLQTATIMDGNGNILDEDYYRYYQPGDVGGQPGDIKYVFSASSFARLTATVSDPFHAKDAQVAPFADSYFQYDNQNRVCEEVVQGAGSSSSSNPLGPGLGAFTYSYTTSTNSAGFNSWQTKTTETLPDGNQNIIYTNAYGEVMLKVLESGGQSWESFTEYDQNSLYDGGRIILQANPSALTGCDDTQANLMNNLANSQGLITLTAYGQSTTAAQQHPET